ncbi:MAG: V-type ATP synthase subunit E [Treponemataceae bacterium]|nr:V-type ATP synthase subunit E [Treponemataceae bacterium]
MDIQLQELLDKIKRDGVEAATTQAEAIIQEAKQRAATIVEQAKKEAETQVKRAQEETARLEKASIAAIEQAARNGLLQFKDEVQALLDRLVTASVEKVYDEKVLQECLPTILTEWVRKGQDSLELLLSPSDVEKLKNSLFKKLSDELARGVELKADRTLKQGFRIAQKDGALYYDFSAPAVAELLCTYLNPRLAEILRGVAGKVGSGE